MRKLLAVAAVLFCSQAYAYINVAGYTKANGTEVAEYVRSEPNGVKYDNYGWKPHQGYFNASYGTHGAYWDKISDEDYYYGYVLHKIGKNSMCRANEKFSSVYNSCGCSDGYSRINGMCSYLEKKGICKS